MRKRLENYFEFSHLGTNGRTEILAGVTTFLTMAYIIFVQPAVLSGKMFGQPTGMDFGAENGDSVARDMTATIYCQH